MNARSLPIVLFVLAACSKAPRESISYSFVDSTGGVTIESEGIRIEVSGSIRYVSHALSSSAGGSRNETTLNGHPFGLRDGVFFIGDSEYGPAPAGAVVRVTEEGVSVDGEKRGMVPAAITVEEEER